MFPASRSSAWAGGCTTTAPSTSDLRTRRPTRSVLPTQYEAFALTVVEALASGLPVVTTTVPGAGDLVRHDVNGLLQHDPLDATELSGLLDQIADPDVRCRLGAAGPASVAELEWSRLIARLDDIVQAVE